MMTSKPIKKFVKSESGNALWLILITVVLFGALSYALMSGRGQSTTSVQAYKVSEEMFTQIQAIRSAILECILVYPDGGYPDDPAPENLVSALECPGKPSQKEIFSGGAGRFLPPPANPFSDWRYTNDDDGSPGTGIRFYAETTSPDQGVSVALDDLESRFAPAEVTVVKGGTSSITIWLKRNL